MPKKNSGTRPRPDPFLGAPEYRIEEMYEPTEKSSDLERNLWFARHPGTLEEAAEHFRAQTAELMRAGLYDESEAAESGKVTLRVSRKDGDRKTNPVVVVVALTSDAREKARWERAPEPGLMAV